MSVLFPQTHNYYPYLDSTRSKGYISTNYDAISTFSGNIQPMSQEDINSLDIGRQNIGKIKIYTDQVFTISKENQENTGDKIVYDNEIYEVIGKDKHTGTLLPHTKYIAELRINDDLG